MEELQKIFGDRFKKNEQMGRHLNFRIGGPAKFFVEVKTIDELQKALEIARKNQVETFVLGGGSNTIFSDEGYDGLVIKLALRKFEINGNTVMAEAGVMSVALARATADAGLEGFTWAISLPGTIGGAVRGNAGCFGGETRDYLTKVEVLRDGKITELSNEELEFGYRESSIKHSDDIVLRAWFELKSGDAEALKKELTETLGKRKDSQPLYAGSAGCIFKNYEATAEEIEELSKKLDIPDSMKEAKRISAGWLIDQMNLKGEKNGDAQISPEHGNFIINLGKATAADISGLISLVKRAAKRLYNIELEEEVKIV